MSQASFSLLFEGSAVDDGRIGVRDLAPALLALGELVEEAHTVLYPDEQPLTLKVEASAEGSFIVDLVVAESLIEQVTNLLSRENIDTASDLLQILGVSAASTTYGLFRLIKWLRGRGIATSRQVERGRVEIETEDGTRLVIPSETFKLFKRVTIRSKAEAAILPLTRDGIDRISFGRNRSAEVTIERDDVPSFATPELDDEQLVESRSEKALQIVSPVFQEGNKWRFNDGSATFYARILDEQFVQRVDDGLQFSKGDILRVSLLTRQWQTDEGLRTEHEVTSVEEHLPRARQIEIPFENNPPDAG